MSKSLQDQLLALGVADKKKAKQAKHQQRVESKNRKGQGFRKAFKKRSKKRGMRKKLETKR